MIVLANGPIEPQRLKPRSRRDSDGTAEAVPFRNQTLVWARRPHHNWRDARATLPICG